MQWRAGQYCWQRYDMPDPSDPKAREFRDCKDGFCASTMVALTNGRYKRGTSEAEIASLRRDFSDHTQLGKDEHPGATWLSVIFGCRQI